MLSPYHGSVETFVLIKNTDFVNGYVRFNFNLTLCLFDDLKAFDGTFAGVIEWAVVLYVSILKLKARW